MTILISVVDLTEVNLLSAISANNPDQLSVNGVPTELCGMDLTILCRSNRHLLLARSIKLDVNRRVLVIATCAGITAFARH